MKIPIYGCRTGTDSQVAKGTNELGGSLRDTSAMESTFRLRRQTSRWARFAEVTVQVIPADEHKVVLGADTFAWRRTVYGPDASSGSSYDDELHLEAQDGAWYALKLPDATPKVQVLVTKILESTADTGPGDVKLAAAHAVWRALGHEPATPPWIDHNGSPVFPEA